MSKNLVIVESPTKAKTISKFLGGQYKIMSSYGHVRDLPQRELGVDVDQDFAPKYVVSKDKQPIVSELRKAAKNAGLVYFATDKDREGEAISWHLLKLLAETKKDIEYKRIVFHEITKAAILDALKNPREIDDSLFDAQQARRVLDRLVGYKLSPFLWKKVAKGLSAGRVQSVTVRLIVEREKEIRKFKPEEYWTLEALLKKPAEGADDQSEAFTTSLNKINGKKIGRMDIKDEAAVKAIVKDLGNAVFEVEDVAKKEAKKNAPAPFTTSSLQQEAYNKLGFSARQTMYLAQNLYEGVKIGREQTGLITYMRTDALNLAESFVEQARELIKNDFGRDFLPENTLKYKTKSKLAQEAHEAVRPTDINNTPKKMEAYLDDKQLKLYELIWKRALACQMNPAKFDNTSIDVKAGAYTLRANGQVIKFPGWLALYADKTRENILPEMKKGEQLELQKLEPKQHFSEPPARYNDASLVKKLEELGIGRPSTYAPTISTIIARNYVKRESGRFVPQEIAFLVTELLKEHFPEIVDFQFTAKMEDDLDEIANGRKEWVPVIAQFYQPFNDNLQKKYMEIDKKKLVEASSDEKCEKCGAAMAIKTSRYGKFLACTTFPKCKNTKKLTGDTGTPPNDGAVNNGEKPEAQMTDIKCEKCGAALVIRQGKFGQFYACSAFPKCRNTKALDQDTGIKCPQCATGKIVMKKTKSKKTFYACDQYPECKFALWSRPNGKKCDNCGSLMVNAGQDEVKCSNKDCGQATTKE